MNLTKDFLTVLLELLKFMAAVFGLAVLAITAALGVVWLLLFIAGYIIRKYDLLEEEN